MIPEEEDFMIWPKITRNWSLLIDNQVNRITGFLTTNNSQSEKLLIIYFELFFTEMSDLPEARFLSTEHKLILQ